jgi:hypothetical protein
VISKSPYAPFVSIIIVTWNCRDYVLRCLKAVSRAEKVSYEVIVSDNGSKDGTVQAIQQSYPDVKLVGSGNNVGFSKANNEAIRHARGNYLLLLNPDTEIPSNALDEFVKAAIRHENKAMIVPRLLNPDDTIQLSGSRWFPTLGSVVRRVKDKMASYLKDNQQSNGDDRYIAWSLGACFFIPVNIYKAVGKLDEQIFMYGEDLDYCWRVHQAGFDVVRIPQIKVVHYGNVSGAQKWGNDRVKKLSQARFYFWHKHFGSLYAFFAALAQVVLYVTQGMCHFLLGGIRSSHTHRLRAQDRLRRARGLIGVLFR